MTLDEVFKKVITFLNKLKVEYIVIGGIAAGTIGEPRMTQDIDIDLLLSKKNIPDFLKKMEKAGFRIDEEKSLKRAQKTGTFQIFLEEYHIDFIIASTDFEREAIKRKKIMNLYDIKGYFPTPEDLILFKIIPGRPIDISDIEKIGIRYSGKLDKKYLTDWARKLSGETEDSRIYNEVKRILKL